MIRERALKVVLVLVGLLFSAAIYPLIGGFRDPGHSDTGDTMMMGLYFTLGIFLLMAVRNPPAHRSLIAFAAWSSFAHAAVMSTLGFEMPTERTGISPRLGGAVSHLRGVDCAGSAKQACRGSRGIGSVGALFQIRGHGRQRYKYTSAHASSTCTR